MLVNTASLIRLVVTAFLIGLSVGGIGGYVFGMTYESNKHRNVEKRG